MLELILHSNCKFDFPYQDVERFTLVQASSVEKSVNLILPLDF